MLLQKRELLLFDESNNIYLFINLELYFIDTISTYLLNSYSTFGVLLDVSSTELRNINGVCCLYSSERKRH